MKQAKLLSIILILLTSLALISILTGCDGQPSQALEEDNPVGGIILPPEELPLAEPEPEPELELEPDPEPIFPEKITVFNASEITLISILEEPSLDSKILGSNYGNILAVTVIEQLDNGFTKIATRDYKSTKLLEGFVPTDKLKEISLAEKYGIVVSLEEQQVYIYEDNELLTSFLCSTGIDENNYFTPEGIYLIGDRGESFFSSRFQQGAYNWVRFNYNYLFHSLPFDENREMIDEEAEKLGQKASHGCIRLSMEDINWFYDNIPRGTPVVIKD